MNELTFKVSNIDNIIVIDLEGVLNTYTVKKFEMAVNLLIQQGFEKLLLSFQNLKEIDTTGCEFLLELSERLKEKQGLLRICGVTYATVKKYLAIKALPKFIGIFNDVKDALANFNEEARLSAQQMISNFYKGQFLELNVPGPNNELIVEFTKIKDIYDTTFLLEWPRNAEGNLVSIYEKSLIVVKFCQILGVFQFQSEVAKKILNPFPALLIRKPSKIQQVQKRKFARAATKMVVNYQKLNPKSIPFGEIKRAVCVDISGGGMLIYAEEELARHTPILLSFRLQNFKVNNVIGKVVRVVENQRAGRRLWEYGIQYTAIFERDRNAIIEYVVKEQGKLYFVAD